jgi:hypothetical protein
MNQIASFRLCKLTNEELLKKVDEETDQIFQNQKVPNRHIPARPDSDYDLLVGELILRFSELLPRQAGQIECSRNCGMNYCDENGCAERKRVLTEPVDKE